MPSIKDLKKRISSVKNTQQTTRAMKMVSAAKLRKSHEAIQNHRPYAKGILNLIQRLSQSMETDLQFPLLKREISSEKESRRILLVLVTSDRGLCGAFNSSVIKTAQRLIQTYSAEGHTVELSFVGRKGNDFFRSKNVKIAVYYSEIGGKVTYLKAKKLAIDLVEKYLSAHFHEIHFIYNEFLNAVSQKVVVEPFLPLYFEQNLTGKNDPIIQKSLDHYIVRPSPQEVLEKLLSKNFEIQAFKILLESQAGEHGARMSAMENATKNAGEMIRKLTLDYNKQRQAGITKELLEIISGSESQKATK